MANVEDPQTGMGTILVVAVWTVVEAVRSAEQSCRGCMLIKPRKPYREVWHGLDTPSGEQDVS